MPHESIDRAIAVFRAACELREEERAPFLDEACGEDFELRRHVNEMLALDAVADVTWQDGMDAIRKQLVEIAESAESEREHTDVMPEAIDEYRILRRIATGGMGVVYEAEQENPRRRVAIKVAREGSPTGERARRFELEVQLLARLSHPGIAQVIAAGTTAEPDGARPYFVMELVDGRSLTDHAREHLHTVREKLALIASICEAVGYAHENNVIHRDLKPDNVLIDGDGAPKVLDFGVAKVEAAGGFGAATLRTQAGRVLGTLGYMAPEQLAGRTAGVGPRADVYALGVMTYELLAGRLPHDLGAVSWTEALGVVTTTEAPRLGVVRPELRGDVEAVVAKALEKDARDRYPDAAALGADIERFLRDEPVRAKRHSTLHRMRKFSRRHRGLVTGVLATIAALVVGLVMALASLRRLEERSLEFDQLAVNVLYARAYGRAQELYPPWPDKIGAMQRWLHEDWERPTAMRPGLEKTVTALRARARPRTPAEVMQDRRADPRFAMWQRMGALLQSKRREEAIRTGAKQLVEPELTRLQKTWPVEMIVWLARDRIWPDVGFREVDEQEALGLALARAAWAKANGTPYEPDARWVLAWALVVNGQDQEANALVARPSPAGLAAHVKALPAMEAEYARVTAAISARKTWSFAENDHASRALHDALAPALGALDRLDGHDKPLVEQNLRWARKVGELSRNHPHARATWSEARAAIAKADGVVASELYAGRTIELRDEDVIGLVPIGMNPKTRLWEFYELRSAWDGKADPLAIAIPEHRSDGTIEITADTGIVFVLLPGGTFVMGAQNADPNQPNYDEQASVDEFPHEVELAPFFMSRFELTQAQWARLMTWAPERREPSRFGGRENLTHPVETVSWPMCNELATRCGMTLPTEAQWEYACRAGTHTPWWPGKSPRDLAGAANLLDVSGARVRLSKGESFDDGFEDHSPVGSFSANGFGLYDVHGNVGEWCRDPFGLYGTERSGDGLCTVAWREPKAHKTPPPVDRYPRIVRGGSFGGFARYARSALRVSAKEPTKNAKVGLRCARPLVRGVGSR